MNKIKFLVIVIVLFTVANFLLVFGFFSGLCIADLAVSPNDVQQHHSYRRYSSEMCTCVPCLPNHYCRKCRHMSFDCPKVKFAVRQTNLSFRVSLTNKLNKYDAKTQSQAK